jgi:hypothetical protein
VNNIELTSAEALRQMSVVASQKAAVRPRLDLSMSQKPTSRRGHSNHPGMLVVGYPIGFEQEQKDMSVTHAEVVPHYRAAYTMAERNHTGKGLQKSAVSP